MRSGSVQRLEKGDDEAGHHIAGEGNDKQAAAGPAHACTDDGDCAGKRTDRVDRYRLPCRRLGHPIPLLRAGRIPAGIASSIAVRKPAVRASRLLSGRRLDRWEIEG